MPTLAELVAGVVSLFGDLDLIVIVAAGVIVGLVAYFAGRLAKRTR
ncbi:MAG: hypothetical protein U1D70_19500 [Methylobacter sp.]|nr:hypothetical protein [Methylobacter sp.]